MAIAGRAKIEQSRQQQLSNIEDKRKTALAHLNIQYAFADKVKTSFGYIGIISLCLLWSSFILNDLTLFLRLCYELAKDLLKERREQNLKEKRKRDEREREIKQVKIQIEEDLYSQELEEKLDQIHWQLVKACARRACEKNGSNKKNCKSFQKLNS